MKRFLFIILFCGLWAAVAAAEPTHVYLIGDSTCATKKLDKENPERGWGQMFQPLFDETIIVENHAVNGRSSRSFREEKRWTPIYDKLQPGDYVFIEFGHNDQKIKTERYAGPDVYAENLRRYIRETREKEAIPVLLTPIVRRHFADDGTLTDTHGDYLTACRRIAAEEHVAFIDAEQITRKWVSEMGDEASRACFMWVERGTCPLYPNGRQDDTHLNVHGARTLARMLAAELPDAVPELAAHLQIPDLVVAKDGSGDFFTVAEAVAAIPDFCRSETVLYIMPGTYREKISIPYTKRNVRMQGRGDVTITWDDYASKIGATGQPLGTSGSSTVYFGGDNWSVSDITFENTAGRVGQAVAVQCLGDNIRFTGCRFLGNQDTLYLHGVGNRDGGNAFENSSYRFSKCYIEGTTDFIFGSASALFCDCEIRSLADSFVTAASTCKGQPCGFVFVDCRLTAADGVTKCYLGRPWREYAQTVFIDCELGGHIRPEGWHDWNKPQAHKHAFYAEYGSTGAGADGQRVKWAHRLSEKQARKIVATFGEE